MKRRDVVAGVASAGVLGGAGTVLWRGNPFGTTESDSGGPGEPSAGDGGESGSEDGGDSVEFRVLEAPGDAPDTMAVPNDGVTVLMFFSPVCSRCEAMVPNVAEAYDRLDAEYGDAFTLASVTAHQSPDRLREWWDDNDGDWILGYEGDRQLSTRYDVVTHPVLLAIDRTGAVRWENEGILEADRIVRNVGRVVESAGGDDASDDADA